ncbi:MAG: acyl-CoA thioesterase [Lachnospiraceae bacterium]|nr:acyl-CoA thioesterase [Lachnospiraceae bacterium]
MMSSYEYQAQYYETDQMGIIHHSNYVRWMESARIWWMSQIGIDYKGMEEKGIISPVLEISCQYKSMVRFEDTVLIEPIIEKYNGITLELSYRITDKESGELRMLGSSKHCFLDRDGKIISLKKSYPEYDRAFAENVRRI